jgi:hypothetical protein
VTTNRVVRTVFIVLVFFTSFGGRAAAATVYSNHLDDYTVSIPDGLPIQSNAASAPDHGFSVVLGGGRRVSVFADYDTLADGSATDALRRSLSYEHWGTEPVLHKTCLAGLPAASARVDLRHRSVVRVIAFRTYDSDTPILYHFYLETDSAHARRDRGVLRAILDGFDHHASAAR